MKPKELTTFKLEHPSFATLSIGKVSGRDRSFGASGYYGQMIRLTISTATLEKRHDSYEATVYPEKQIVEVEMTPLQFATAISVIGGDTPCTIVWRDGKRVAQPEEVTTRREMIEEDFKRHQEELAKECDVFVQEAVALRDKANVGKGDRDRFVKLAESLRDQIKNSQPHIASKFTDLIQDMLVEVKLSKHNQEPAGRVLSVNECAEQFESYATANERPSRVEVCRAYRHASTFLKQFCKDYKDK